jgi:hypothetical protein
VVEEEVAAEEESEERWRVMATARDASRAAVNE